MPRNDNYITGNLLDYLFHQKYYKLIGIHFLRQTNTSFSHQINFVGKLEDDGGIMFFIAKKQQKTIFKLFLDLLFVTE